jgi:hypothetical protein
MVVGDVEGLDLAVGVAATQREHRLGRRPDERLDAPRRGVARLGIPSKDPVADLDLSRATKIVCVTLCSLFAMSLCHSFTQLPLQFYGEWSFHARLSRHAWLRVSVKHNEHSI